MPKVVKIRSELFPRLYSAFLHDDDPMSTEQDWRNIFDYRWEKEEDYTGYAMLEGDAVVGMMAMAFSQRQIDGKTEKFCNLHTWWVHEDFRGHSIAMLRPLLHMKEYTITHFTPCDRIRALTRRLGFSQLDMQMKLLLPFGRSRGPLPAAELRFDSDIDSSRLGKADLRIMNDHLPYRVGNLMMRRADREIYVLYTFVERYRVRYCHIHYVSDLEAFPAFDADIRQALCKRHGVKLVIIDARLVRDMAVPASFDFWAPAHGVFRPVGAVTANQVDNLYSDIVMLRLAAMPHVSHEIRQLAGRLIPGVRTESGKLSQV